GAILSAPSLVHLSPWPVVGSNGRLRSCAGMIWKLPPTRTFRLRAMRLLPPLGHRAEVNGHGHLGNLSAVVLKQVVARVQRRQEHPALVQGALGLPDVQQHQLAGVEADELARVLALGDVL